MTHLDNRDWTPLGFLHNPVPGSPEGLAVMLRSYRKRQETFESMADSLRTLGSNSGLQGNFADKFAGEVGDLPKDFQSFADSFGAVHAELSEWSTELESYQRQASSALDDAEAALEAQKKSQSLVDAQRNECSKKGSALAFPASTDAATKNKALQEWNDAQGLLDSYTSQLSSASDKLNDAKSTITRVISDYNDTGRKHASKITSTQSVAPKVNVFEQVYYSDCWKIIIKGIEVLAAAVAVAGLFVGGWVIALVGAGLAAVIFTDRLVAFREGDISGAEFGVETVFAVLSIVPAVGPIRAAAKGMKGVRAANLAPFNKMKPFLKDIATNGWGFVKNAGTTIVHSGARGPAAGMMKSQLKQEAKHCAYSLYHTVAKGGVDKLTLKKFRDASSVVAKQSKGWSGTATEKTVQFMRAAHHQHLATTLSKGATAWKDTSVDLVTDPKKIVDDFPEFVAKINPVGGLYYAVKDYEDTVKATLTQ